MPPEQFSERAEQMVRRYEYEDEVVVAADLGVADEAVTVDVLDDRAIVVVEREDDTSQMEIELPEGGTAKAFINNGIVTLEVGP